MKAGARILVVDDEPMNVELLKAILESNGYAVACAANGSEALESLDREKCDLVLLDVMMPVINGFETVRSIRANPATQGLPVILITALHEVKERIIGIEAGCDAFVTKPFDKAELLARVKALIQQSAQRAQEDEQGKFEHVINRMNDGLIVCDAGLRIVQSNRQGREFLGDEGGSADWLLRLAGAFKVGYPGDLKKNLLTRDLDFDIERAEAAGVMPLVLSFSSRLIMDAAGKAGSVVIVLHDVTKYRKRHLGSRNYWEFG